jgi:hypothetical protein
MKERLFKYLAPTSFPCFNFLRNGIEQKKTVIIAPIVIREENKAIRITYACNRGRACEDPDCRYSKAAQEEGERWEV